MPLDLAELDSRVRKLEDQESIRALITKEETLRDGKSVESVEEILKLVTDDVRFVWSMEGMEVKGKDRLRENLLVPTKNRIWSKHVITNLQVEVDGDKAEATWYVMAEGVSSVQPSTAKADDHSRHTSPGDPSTLLHNDTKGGKWAALVRTPDGWKIEDYRTDMVRLGPTTLKFR